MTVDTQMLPSSTRYITYEEYLCNEEENHHTEWVDGKVIDISSITDEQCQLRQFFLLALMIWVVAYGRGVVHAAPFNMKTGTTLPGRAPKVMYIANANRSRIHNTHLEGPCDLAVEVISSDSRIRDTIEKIQEYAAGGVPEYWICDSERRQTRFYALNKNGNYEEILWG